MSAVGVSTPKPRKRKLLSSQELNEKYVEKKNNSLVEKENKNPELPPPRVRKSKIPKPTKKDGYLKCYPPLNLNVQKKNQIDVGPIDHDDQKEIKRQRCLESMEFSTKMLEKIEKKTTKLMAEFANLINSKINQ